MEIKKKKRLSEYARQRIAYWEDQWLDMREKRDILELRLATHRRQRDEAQEKAYKYQYQLAAAQAKVKECKNDRSILVFSLFLNMVSIIAFIVILGG